MRVDVNSLSSHKSGFAGLFEATLRRFKSFLHGVMLLPFYGLACLSAGVALVPGFYVYHWVAGVTGGAPEVVRFLGDGISLGVGFFLYGFTLVLLVPAINFVGRCYLKPWRGPYYSLEAIRWYIHNGATYLLRYTFLEFITPSPFNNWFYQMMGMKIGRGTIINSTNISDPSLIELGAKVTIGGSVTIVGHYGQGGYLIMNRVLIGDGATIGLKATIMGGAIIGKGAKILPHSVVLPNTVIPDGETWGGVPAQKINMLKRVA